MFKKLLLCVLPALISASGDCSRESYDGCIRIADPLVKEPHLIFPDNMEDINRVCRTWDQFVNCLKDYTENCFTEQQRRQFNKAVENPIESVHQMCTQPNYQREYLQYASCIKNTITERIHCGPQYNLLVDQVSQGDIISKSTLCCSHDRFKQCVLRETRRLCDRGQTDGPASRFSSQIIDKALSFLQDQCYNYIPNSGDCNTLTTDSHAFSDPLTISTSSSEVHPWTTIQDVPVQKEILSSRVTPPKIQTSSWLPSSSVSIQNPTSTEMLGSRTRPASYGRSNSWNDNNNNNRVGNTVQMYPDTSTPSSRPDWATGTSWQPDGNTNNSPNADDRRTTVWYPAAGVQTGNEVEEPNQQGLTKPKDNAGARVQAGFFVMAAFALMTGF